MSLICNGLSIPALGMGSDQCCLMLRKEPDSLSDYAPSVAGTGDTDVQGIHHRKAYRRNGSCLRLTPLAALRTGQDGTIVAAIIG